MHQSSKEIEEEWEIIQRAQKHPEAFGLLYERYYPHIFLFVERRMGEKDLAADVTSQVFLKAMLKLGEYKFKGLPFSAWLYRVATNQVNEHYRKSRKQRVVSVDDGHYERLLLDVKAETSDSSSLPDPALVLNRLLDSLNEEEVQLLELRFFEERPFKEVAFILNITENNAKVRSYRIVEKLKKIVAKWIWAQLNIKSV